MINSNSLINSNMSKFNRVLRLLINEYIIIVVILLLSGYTAVKQPEFVSLGNLSNILRQLSPIGLVSLGMTVVIIGGYIDLSVAGMFSMVAVMTTAFLHKLYISQAILLGLAIGSFAGFLNSMIMLKFGARDDTDALFITYGMSLVYGALALIFSSGVTVRIPRGTWFSTIGQGMIGPIPVAFIIFTICAVFLQFFMKSTCFGRYIHLNGGNPEASRFCGIPVWNCVVLIYVIVGFMTAAGAIVLVSRVTTGSPVIGRGFELNAIMSVVIGGTTLKGGHGSILNTVFGVVLVTIMANALNILGINANMQSFARGVILVAAIWLDSRRTR